MSLPKLVIFDKDGTLSVSSSDPSSPLYYITELDHVILKPGAKEACQVVAAHGVPMVMATKQRCIGKGLVSRERVDLVNRRVERLLGISFEEILVEETHENKINLYHRILARWSTNPQSMHLFDDNKDERIIASRMGITTWDGANLFESVSKAFSLR
jgi:histidinol phosphatase-like enzyme